MKQYDIFISYRRKETADKAEHLFTLLEHEGYKGRDRENLDGRFDIEILKRLDNCKDFIVILSSDTLSTIRGEDTGWYHRLACCTIDEFPFIEMEMKKAGGSLDFVRLEIARALAKGKHVIPVVPINSLIYNFDSLKLTDDICLLTKQHAERYQDTKDFLFKDILPRIVKRLKSRPQKHVWAKHAVIIVFSVILVACMAGWMKWSKEKNVFQSCRTQSEFEEFAQDSYFFRSECVDSLSCFETLARSKTPINDAFYTGLAVLSACNTGIGGKGTDGIFGLQRGFKNAGVHSLLMSLKPVYDESTAKLMIAFYQGLAQGKSKRESLLNAQNTIKATGYKDGKYWAPFILLDGIN